MSEFKKTFSANEIVCPNAQRQEKEGLQRTEATLLWLEDLWR